MSWANCSPVLGFKLVNIMGKVSQPQELQWEVAQSVTVMGRCVLELGGH